MKSIICEFATEDEQHASCHASPEECGCGCHAIAERHRLRMLLTVEAQNDAQALRDLGFERTADEWAA